MQGINSKRIPKKKEQRLLRETKRLGKNQNAGQRLLQNAKLKDGQNLRQKNKHPS